MPAFRAACRRALAADGVGARRGRGLDVAGARVMAALVAVPGRARNQAKPRVAAGIPALSSQESETKVVGRHRAHFERRAVKVASTDLSVSAVRRFRDLAAGADVVHYHYPWPMMDLAHFLVLHGKPSVVTYHSDIVRQRFLYRFYQPIMHRFLSSADAIVATLRRVTSEHD